MNGTAYTDTGAMAGTQGPLPPGSLTTDTTAMPAARAFFSLVVETATNVSGFTGVARLYVVIAAGYRLVF